MSKELNKTIPKSLKSPSKRSKQPKLTTQVYQLYSHSCEACNPMTVACSHLKSYTYPSTSKIKKVIVAFTCYTMLKFSLERSSQETNTPS